jgi:hypothetical protein
VTHFVNVTSALLWFLAPAGEAVPAGRAWATTAKLAATTTARARSNPKMRFMVILPSWV